MAKKTAKPKKEAEAAPEVSATSTVSVSVYTAQGGFVRSYSRDDHGAGFKDLAKQYAAKIHGIVQ